MVKMRLTQTALQSAPFSVLVFLLFEQRLCSVVSLAMKLFYIEQKVRITIRAFGWAQVRLPRPKGSCIVREVFWVSG